MSQKSEIDQSFEGFFDTFNSSQSPQSPQLSFSSSSSSSSSMKIADPKKCIDVTLPEPTSHEFFSKPIFQSPPPISNLPTLEELDIVTTMESEEHVDVDKTESLKKLINLNSS